MPTSLEPSAGRAPTAALVPLDVRVFVNSDLTINLLRRPVGEWICLDARAHLSSRGGGITKRAEVAGHLARDIPRERGLPQTALALAAASNPSAAKCCPSKMLVDCQGSIRMLTI